eukprot:COSAG03_NODE_894_length_5464_cov_8.128984_9_plen_51_part_00
MLIGAAEASQFQVVYTVVVLLRPTGHLLLIPPPAPRALRLERTAVAISLI